MNLPFPKAGDTWRHFRGDVYVVQTIGRHSETQELLVVYTREDENGGDAWVRPLSDWMAFVKDKPIPAGPPVKYPAGMEEHLPIQGSTYSGPRFTPVDTSFK